MSFTIAQAVIIGNICIILCMEYPKLKSFQVDLCLFVCLITTALCFAKGVPDGRYMPSF